MECMYTFIMYRPVIVAKNIQSYRRKRRLRRNECKLLVINCVYIGTIIWSFITCLVLSQNQN